MGEYGADGSKRSDRGSSLMYGSSVTGRACVCSFAAMCIVVALNSWLTAITPICAVYQGIDYRVGNSHDEQTLLYPCIHIFGSSSVDHVPERTI
jgi:hypothetical protein